MKFTRMFMLSAAIFFGAVATAPAVVQLTAAGSYNVTLGEFGSISVDRGNLGSVSASQQGGAYRDVSNNGVVLVGSGSAQNNYFELTITNDTGLTITGLSFSGVRLQHKDNSSNIIEIATASQQGGDFLVDPSVFTFTSISNNGNSTSDVGFISTADYFVDLGTIEFLAGQSFTLRWTDGNDGGTDALYGLGDIVITATTANVPEPSGALFLGAAGLGVMVMRRRRKIA